MAYERQWFEDGQTLKASHLNAMEDGIAEAHDGIAVLEPVISNVDITSGTTVLATGKSYHVYV